MDAVTLLVVAGIAAGFFVILRARRRGKRSGPADRIDFELHKSREMGTRGLAGRS